MSKAGKRLIAAAQEAVAIARGEQKPARSIVPADINVKAIRLKLDLSQADFAAEFGFTVNQVRDWEQKRSKPLGGVRTYLMLIERAPKEVRTLLIKAHAEAHSHEAAPARAACQ